MSKINDASQSQDPQYTLGATSSEAEMHAQIARNPLEGPGGIVNTLGLQYQLPRYDNPDNETDASISRDSHGQPNG